jgi:hypothetical protein
MEGKHDGRITKNDAGGIMTAEHSDGHLWWPSDYELHDGAMTSEQ